MAQIPTQWKINIIGHDVKPASWFLGNEKNVKIHPHAQSAITEGSLNELGWLRPVIVNKRTAEVWGRDRGVETLLDGHDRIKLALRKDEETPVPLDYVDLTPADEDLALLILDEMTGMAVKDKEKLSQLMYTTKPSDAALVQALADMAAREGLVPPDDPHAEWQGMPEFAHEDQMAFQSIMLHFKDEDAVRDFSKLVHQKITPKTKSLWFPDDGLGSLNATYIGDES